MVESTLDVALFTSFPAKSNRSCKLSSRMDEAETGPQEKALSLSLKDFFGNTAGKLLEKTVADSWL